MPVAHRSSLPVGAGLLPATRRASATARCADVALGVSLAGRSRRRCCCGRASIRRRADFQFVERHAWIPAFGISYYVGVDGISLLLLVLTGFLTPLALLCSWESVHKNVKAFCIFCCCSRAR